MNDQKQDSVRVFVGKKKNGLKAALLIGGGLLFLLILLGFVILLATRPARPGMDWTPGFIGGISIIGIGMLMYGVFLLRSSSRVVLDPVGVHIDTFLGRRSVAWSEITRVERSNKSLLITGIKYKVIRLIDRNDKTVAVIDETIDGFEILLTEIADRSSAAAGRQTCNPVRDEQKRIKSETRNIKWTSPPPPGDLRFSHWPWRPACARASTKNITHAGSSTKPCRWTQQSCVAGWSE